MLKPKQITRPYTRCQFKYRSLLNRNNFNFRFQVYDRIIENNLNIFCSYHVALVLFLGTSDPYVKIKQHSKCMFKTKIVYRNLNPTWNEHFQLALDDINSELVFKVYDFDRLSHDDDMGEASVSLGSIEINKYAIFVLLQYFIISLFRFLINFLSAIL